MRPAGILVLLVALAASAASTATAATAATVTEFRTPSGNIGCVYSSGLSGAEAPTVRCDIRSRLKPSPTPPASCPLDYGDSIQVSKSGKAILVCHGDTAIDPTSRVLAYGRTWKRGGVACVSQAIGLRCTNAGGHGFFLSRESWSIS